jgi:hypothetical protein
MMAASPSPRLAYVWEPFSPLHRPGICDARFPYWFQYVCEENEALFARAVGDMLAFRYKPKAELRAVRTPKDAARMARDWAEFLRNRRRGAVPLLKDPIAVLSASWLADTFDMDVVVLIRHPAAFVYSLKRRNWTHPFDHFLKQPLLIRDLLKPFESELRRACSAPYPVVDQGILLWNIVHSAVSQYRERRHDWLFARLEDVARDPVAVFGDLFHRFGLAFDESVRATVLDHSGSANPSEVDSPSEIRRNSRASIVAWKTGLTDEEIGRVRTGVEHISQEFYTDADW